MDERYRLNVGGRQLRVRWTGFGEEEVIEIRAKSLRAAFAELGRGMAPAVKQVLRSYRWDVGETNWTRMLETVEVKMGELRGLAESGILTVNGVNWLKRYWEAFEGYCSGAQISPVEGAYLQMELEAGCQSMLVQDTDTGEVRMIHTEEDMDYVQSERGQYDYKVVLMNIDGVEANFFTYPGLCGWGPAFGINISSGLVMAVDDLYTKPEFNQGVIWANALAFMVFDAGEAEKISDLLKVIVQIDGMKFSGGYAMHMAWSGQSTRMQSVEFGGDRVRLISPVTYQNRLIVGQANCPINLDLQRFSEAAGPEGTMWSREGAELYVEMKERRERLVDTGMSTDWLKKDATESVAIGLKILADPHGDIGRYIDDDGHIKYYVSGLPSRVTVAHMVAYVAKDELYFYSGRLRPRPIGGLEYSIRVNQDYPYGLKKIWLEAEKMRRDYMARKLE